MFESLTDRLGGALKSITGKARLTEDNIAEALREVRVALLDADVALPVVTNFIAQVKARALGQEVTASLSPGQEFIRVVNDELTAVMTAPEGSAINLNVQPPAVILMAGLQGTGKTSTAAKLAHHLQSRERKKVMLVSADVYRPAAIDQLRTLAEQSKALFCESSPDEAPLAIAKRAIQTARKQFADVLIVDTAGRLHLDDQMMAEIAKLHKALTPAETLFVVDALTGQDAANTAQAFASQLPLTGVVLTKVDGDSRGGAALSVRAITGKPIKFMALGEGIDALEAFHPERIASRILGMGDVLTLIEEADQKLDKKKAQKLAKKLKKGKKFDLEDFRDQLQQMKNLGGLSAMMDKLPGAAGMAGAPPGMPDEKSFAKFEAIINSMTPGERRYPDVISGSRKKRIATGSGTQPQDVSRLLKQHKQMQKMMKKLGKKGGMQNMMRGMNGMMQQGAGFPPR